MSEHRRAFTRPAGTSVTWRQRLLVGGVGALGASGLILGSIGFPVSAGDVNAVGKPYTTVDVHDGCLTAEAGTGEADGSVVPQGSDAAALDANGQATATVTVCGDDLDAPSPDDPGGSLPDDPGDTVLDDVVPGEPGRSVEGELVAIVTAALDGDLPGGGDGSDPGDLPGGLDDIVPDGGDGFPGDPGDGSWPGDPGDLPGGLGGLVPDGSGLGAGDLLERLGELIAGVGDGGGPGGNDGNGAGGGSGGSRGAPALSTSTKGSGSVEVGGVDSGGGDPSGVVPGGEIGDGTPALVGTSVSPGGTLPRTGGGLGHGVLRLVALMGLGRGFAGLAKRR